MNQAKRGKIQLTNEMLEQGDKMRAIIFEHFVPVNMEYDHNRNMWTYFGYSKHFDECAEGSETPFYIPHNNEDGVFTGFKKYYHDSDMHYLYQYIDRHMYSQADLVNFGNYLLSNSRNETVLEENKQYVTHADLENYNNIREAI